MMNSSETARVLCPVPASRAANGPAVLAAGRVGGVLGTLIKRQQPGGWPGYVAGTLTVIS